MITCRLKGGLGNQMFQIAATIALSKKLNTEAIFDLNACYTPEQGFTSNKYKTTLLKNLTNKKLSTVNLNTTYNEPKFSYLELPKKNNIILNGYFQSEKYFKEYEREIKDIFKVDELKKIEIQEHLSKFDEITAIHVRRGDYLKLPKYHPVCPISYYKKAMKIIGNNSDFIFISDDIEWCKENFKGKNIHFSPFNNEIDDFYLITLCDNQIISNSSFSWWGAYLCEYYNNIVIAPNIWFGPNGPKDTQDLIPKNWIKI